MRTVPKTATKSLARIELTVTAVLLGAFVAALFGFVPGDGGVHTESARMLPVSGSVVGLFVAAAVLAVAIGALLAKRSGRA